MPDLLLSSSRSKMTQSGHPAPWHFAAQINRSPPFLSLEIPAVIHSLGVVLSLGEGNETTRSRQRNCRIGCDLASCCVHFTPLSSPDGVRVKDSVRGRTLRPSKSPA
jgi:hypothetical protein